MRTLLIDDSLEQRETTRALLEVADHEVLVADSGPAGLALMASEKLDVVLCDLEMPGMDGLEVVRLARQCGFLVPVVVLTGHAEVHRVIEVMKRGAFSYVMKGTAPELLLKEVEDAAQMHRLLVRSRELEAANQRHQDYLEDLVAQKTRELAENERRRAEAERLATLGTLVAGVAHEFNNPLAVVISNVRWIAELISEVRPANPELGEALDETLVSAHRMAALVKRLRVFGRPPEKGTSDVRKVLGTAMSIAQVEAEGIRIETSISDDVDTLPLGTDDAVTVISNLVVNASHAMRGRAGAIRVEIASCGINGVRVSVQDDGMGIPAELIGRVCDPFFTTKAPGKGTGLGLALVNQIARSCGGAVQIESTVGVGTTVTLALPTSLPAPRSLAA